MTSRAWKALEASNDPPRLFRQGGDIVRVVPGERGDLVAEAVTKDRMQYELARAAHWVKGRAEAKPTNPPRDVISDVLATPSPPLPVLERIVEAPVFAKDGSCPSSPGYHLPSRTIFHPPPGFSLLPLQRAPSTADMVKARALILDDLLVDFPFVNDAGRAHALALYLLPFARDLIGSPTPLHLIAKPKAGTGGTLLGQMLVFPSVGVPSITTEGSNEEEWRRRITAKLRSASPILFLDNIKRPLDSPQLAGAITSPFWEDRQIGTSNNVRLPVSLVWVATGNNPKLSDEIARRSIHIRLDACRERPGEGRKYKHPNLTKWAQSNRSQLIWSALVMISAWVAEGRPAATERLASFESWSEVIGGILAVNGVPGFLSNRESLYEAVEEEEAIWRSFVASWWAAFPHKAVAAADLVALASRAGIDLGEGDEHNRARRLGLQVRERRDRIFSVGEMAPMRVRLEAGARVNNSNTWRLSEVENGGEGTKGSATGGMSNGC